MDQGDAATGFRGVLRHSGTFKLESVPEITDFDGEMVFGRMGGNSHDRRIFRDALNSAIADTVDTGLCDGESDIGNLPVIEGEALGDLLDRAPRWTQIVLAE